MELARGPAVAVLLRGFLPVIVSGWRTGRPAAAA